MRLVLPTIINATGLIPFLSLLGSLPEFETEIRLDFSALRRVSPAGMAALVAAVHRWQAQRKRVLFEELSTCAILGYLQRMDVLRNCGVELAETFYRHPTRARFVPVQRIVDVDTISRDIAACIAPGGEDYGHELSPLYDLIVYVIGELGYNVRQHSFGTGFVVAQTNVSEGLIRLAVADNGMGVRQSFVEAGFPWSNGLTDSAALRKALEPRVSSKGEPVNQGVGLTLVSGLARLTGAWLLLVSGTGVLQLNPGGTQLESELPNRSRHNGTLIALTFRQDKLHAFYNLLDEAKQQAGLLVKRPIITKFT